jgi:hypothetical protein
MGKLSPSILRLQAHHSPSLKVLTALGLTTSWADAIQSYERSSELTYDGTLLAESAFASRLIVGVGGEPIS